MRALIIDFKLDMSTAEYERMGEMVAPEIAKVPGLIRKTWIWNDRTREAGGIYLFEDEASVELYLSGPIVGALRGLPQVSDMHVRQFSVLRSASSLTRGIEQPVAAGEYQ